MLQQDFDAKRERADDAASGSGSGTDEDSDSPDEDVQLSCKLSMFEFGQNDPKMDSGSRMVRFGLARAMKPDAAYQGVVLSTATDVLISARDKELVMTCGIAGVNCSWNRLDEIPWDRLKKKGQHRTLPFLVAANTVNYGRPWKLNTAEAIAACLYIVGLEADARAALRPFSWGKEFLRLNHEVLELYRSAPDSAGVRAKQVEHLARCEAEAIARKSRGMDLPPGSSDEEDSASDAAGAEAGGGPQGSPSPEVPRPVEDTMPAAGTPATGSAGGAAAPAALQPRPRPVKRAPAREAAPAAPTAPPVAEPEAPETPEAPLITPDMEAPPPKEQKATLAAIQAVSPADFAASADIAGLSGNALAKLKRSDFEAIWARFREEVAPRLRSEQALQVLGASDARKQGAGKAGPRKR